MPGAPDNDKDCREIEITPEMIEAGLRHLYWYHPDRGVDEEETLVRIFSSMKAARTHLYGECLASDRRH